MNVIVLNGCPRSGKDEFAKIASEIYKTRNISSIDNVKEFALHMGWDGNKSKLGREMLSELKAFYIKYFDGPFNDIKKEIQRSIIDNIDILFVHIREPEEIDKLVKYCEEINISIYTIIIQRPEYIHLCEDSKSDKKVYDHKYDYMIINNGSIEEYREKVKKFIKYIIAP